MHMRRRQRPGCHPGQAGRALWGAKRPPQHPRHSAQAHHQLGPPSPHACTPAATTSRTIWT
eukprot:scaffold64070_cov18-Tisochrysis_lutea.AAC.3